MVFCGTAVWAFGAATGPGCLPDQNIYSKDGRGRSDDQHEAVVQFLLDHGSEAEAEAPEFPK
jgi:hypothetical protein